MSLNGVIDGNRMACNGHGDVFLELKDEKGRVRKIGQIYDHEQGVTYRKVVKSQHTFKATKGWGLNAAVLNALNEVDGRVLIVAPDADYLITAWGALAIGDWLYFKSQKCEKQVFVKQENFIKSKRYIARKA